MRIELSLPFSNDWKYGYLQTHSNGRKYICLFNSNKDRTLISYARYLMCVHIGKYISSEYEVDHIDNDKTNDTIANLQIVTKEYNRLKEYYNYIMHEQISWGYECAWCFIPFIGKLCVKHRP